MSNTQSVQITSKGIQNSLKKYDPLTALVEYIWNGFDAEAIEINITIENNGLGIVSFITIQDNGVGIDRTELDSKFKPFFQSEKVYNPKDKHSDTHGKNGVGRLTFFTFCNSAFWQTVYEKDG